MFFVADDLFHACLTSDDVKARVIPDVLETSREHRRYLTLVRADGSRQPLKRAILVADAGVDACEVRVGDRVAWPRCDTVGHLQGLVTLPSRGVRHAEERFDQDIAGGELQ